MKEYYEKKVAVITGGASGIGLAICEEILAMDAKAVVLADVNEENLAREVTRLDGLYPHKVFSVKTDVTKEKSVQEMVARAAEIGNGRLDLLFNNAGVGLLKWFGETTNEDWKFAFDVNFYSVLFGVRAALPIMIAQGGGHIANTASGIAFSPFPAQSMYAATKSALVNFTLSLRAEYWQDNVRFSVVIPGTVATPIWQGHAPATAITPKVAAERILAGIAENRRLVITTDEDRSGLESMGAQAKNPEYMKGLDDYLLNVAEKRRKGTAEY
jgi:NAD(P)-dependent dehydrogenase (short-subunit alcohol dehydrogenase family)